MQQKNNSPQRKYVLAALGTAAVVLGTGYAFLGPVLLPAGESVGMQTVSESVQFIVNQGLGMGIDGTDGELYPMDMLVADRNTGFFVRIEPEVWQEVGGQPTLLVSDGTYTWQFADSEYWEGYELLCFDTSEQTSWAAGQYDIRVDLAQGGMLEREIVFNEMRDIEILVVPIAGYYGGETKKADSLGKNRYRLSEAVEGTSPYIVGGTADEGQGSGTIIYAQ